MMHDLKRSERVSHGALDYAELDRLGLRADEVLDFSVNSNPYGPSPLVYEALAGVHIERYPDRACLQLRKTLLATELAALDLPLSSVVCGNGASELIWATARAFLSSSESAAISEPTFGEYHAATVAVGAQVITIFADRENAFCHDVQAICSWLESAKPRLVWLCNPNNPTGAWLDQNEMILIAIVCRKIGALLVIDESYRHFLFPQERDFTPTLLREHADHVLLIRSLTKDFVLAGLRLGYAVGAPELISRLAAQLPSWNVNSMAQAAGVAALNDPWHLDATLLQLAIERRAFFAALEQAGYTIVPSRTHYCLIHVGQAAQVRQDLLARKILVRDCSSFGLSQYIRVATRPAADWQCLLQALREVL